VAVECGLAGPPAYPRREPEASDADKQGDPACLSATKVGAVDCDAFMARPVRPKTLEVISQTISDLLQRHPRSCLWCTATFPPERVGRESRQRAFDSWRKAVLEPLGMSVWVPEAHESGEIHFHGVWCVPGRDFVSGFDHYSREKWVSLRSKLLLNLWKSSGSPDLRSLWAVRDSWRKYGIGHVDIVPLRPGSVPIAVARYMASYASQGGHPKGSRLVRRVGYKKYRKQAAACEMSGGPCLCSVPHHEGVLLKSADFSFAGPRSRLFGACRLLGEKLGYGLEVQANGKRRRGWALVSAVAGVSDIILGERACDYLESWSYVRGFVRTYTGCSLDLSEDLTHAALSGVGRGMVLSFRGSGWAGASGGSEWYRREHYHRMLVRALDLICRNATDWCPTGIQKNE